MMQTLAAVCITWGFFMWRCICTRVAALVLMAAVAMVQRVQSPSHNRHLCSCWLVVAALKSASKSKNIMVIDRRYSRYNDPNKRLAITLPFVI
jgi:hypothetical protein